MKFMSRFLNDTLTVCVAAPFMGCCRRGVADHVKHMALSDRVVFRRVMQKRDQETVPTSKPTVILFQWLGARQNALDKYCQLYHDRGLDVITVKGRLLDFVWPSTVSSSAKSILECLRGANENSVGQKYLIHAFSIGAYIHTVCLMLAHRDPIKYAWYRQSIKGSVFDSIVIGSLENMISGMANYVSDIHSIQRLVRQLGGMYYYLNTAKTLEFYDECVAFFKLHPVLAPSLYLFSHDDPMCDVHAMEELVKTWKTDFPSIELSVKSWKHSRHAAHIRHHEEEYKAALHTFLSSLNV